MSRRWLALTLVACSCSDGVASRHVAVTIDASRATSHVSERFVSFAVDSAQLVGALFWSPDAVPQAQGISPVTPYDFSHDKLRKLTRALAPAYLRIGGTDADKLYYDLSRTPVANPPAGYDYVMTADQWDRVNSFAHDLGLSVLFTLNAGPGPRDADGMWTPDNARALMAYTVERDYPVQVWELGNEINGYTAIHGFELAADRYVSDAAAARSLIDEVDPDSWLTGPSIAYWPVVGEFLGMYEDVMAGGLGQSLDLLTWHYYPQQSSRCLITTRRAKSGVLLDAAHLDEVNRWADVVEGLRDAHAPNTPVWLGETGNAQCGGEPLISDAYEGGFWWLDQLGQMALRGQPVVVRQTLSGSNYGLIDDVTLEPNPDYFNSLLWRRLMGTTVLRVELPRDELALRAYAHCAAATADGGVGGISIVVLNLDPERVAEVALPLGSELRQYIVTAESLESRRLVVNGQPLEAQADGTPPEIASLAVRADTLRIPPHAYAFAVIVDAAAPACM